jgi:hypothetical protein
MPAKPCWIHRLPEIMEQIEKMDVPLLDRRIIEKLFEVRPRRAQLLLREFSAYMLGNSMVIERQALLARLEELGRRDTSAQEQRRRARVAEALEQARSELAGRKVRIPVARDVVRRQFSGLPPEIRFEGDELHIRFHGAEDLLGRLYELSQAILDDYQRFKTLVEMDGGASYRPSDEDKVSC